ncbi:MAG: cation:proton antiporter [Nitrospinota bacterium]|nr:cation:proton antiporter [Nitrospinota bacterium]MDH5677248.1 cation:proton antiporter [Nitrospinota bacterium]MDH5757682.1 cation:proton antiporter [Nitrospinota bacterium]
MSLNRALRIGAVAGLATGLILLARSIGAELGIASSMAESAMALGFLLLFAFFLGQAAPVIGAPRITGYLLAGIAAGPYALNLISAQNAEPLRLVNGLALSLIAFTAGGELKLERYKPRIKALSLAVAGQSLAALFFVMAVMFPAFYFSGVTEGVSASTPLASAFGAALLLGILSMANSPATAVAVITEGRAKGPVSEIVMGSTVIVDVVVILVFGMLAPVVGYFLGMAHSDQASGVLRHIGGAVVIGLGAGGMMILILRQTKENVALWISGMAMALSEVAIHFHVSAMLAAIVAGFMVENFSKSGEKLIKAIEYSSAPVYVIFFSLAGQGLDLSALVANLPLALALVFSRMGAVWLGVNTGLKMAGEPVEMRRNAWQGFIGQAGINIGFAVLAQQIFGPVGAIVATIAISAVAVNQVAGPIMMRRALVVAGEIPSGAPTAQESKAQTPA